MQPLWKQILNINPLSSAGEAVAPLWQKILQPRQPVQSMQPKTTDTLLPSTKNIAPLWQRILNQDIYKSGSPPAQARQSARLLGEEVRQKVGQPFAQGAMQTFQKAGEITEKAMSPGTTYLTPQLQKYGVNPTVAFGVGLGVDILAPGPGELKGVSKLSKADNINPLIQAKGKTLDEFLNSRPSLFHTTSKEAAQAIEQSGFKGQIGERSAATTLVKNKGVFLYDDVSPTKEFGKNIVRTGKEPAVVEAKINGKIFNSTDEYASINALAGDTKLINKLKTEGYVGIRGEEMGTPVTFVFDTNALKTKSQLTDLWKAENKKVNLPKADISPAQKAEGKIYYRATEDGKTLGIGQKWAWTDKEKAEAWAKRNNAKVVEFTVPDEAIDPIDLSRMKSKTTDRFQFNTSKAQVISGWKEANK